MKKKYTVFGLLLMLFGLLSGCGPKSVEVYCKSVYSNTMDCMVIPGEEVTETAEPEFEEIILTKGENPSYGVSVVSIKEDRVVFLYDEDCFSARVYSAAEDGSFLREGARGKVTLYRGEQLTLEEIALLDESHTVCIRLK